MLYTFLVIAIYISFSELINTCYILEDSILIVYYFRFRKRKICIKNLNITQIKFINQAVLSGYPNIQFEINHKKIKMEMPSNSFPIHSFKKRRNILRFFESKGIPIEIISDFEKDWTILEK